MSSELKAIAAHLTSGILASFQFPPTNQPSAAERATGAVTVYEAVLAELQSRHGMGEVIEQAKRG